MVNIHSRKAMLAALNSEMSKMFGINAENVKNEFGIYVENHPSGGFELGANNLWLSTNNFMDNPVCNREGIRAFLDELKNNVGMICENAKEAEGDWGDRFAAVAYAMNAARLVGLGEYECAEDYFDENDLESMCGDVYECFADYIDIHMDEYEKTPDGLVLDSELVQNALMDFAEKWIWGWFNDYVEDYLYAMFDSFKEMAWDSVNAFDFIYWLDDDIFYGMDEGVLLFTEEFKKTDDYKRLIAA